MIGPAHAALLVDQVTSALRSSKKEKIITTPLPVQRLELKCGLEMFLKYHQQILNFTIHDLIIVIIMIAIVS